MEKFLFLINVLWMLKFYKIFRTERSVSIPRFRYSIASKFIHIV